MSSSLSVPSRRSIQLARVLLADDDPAARLTLQTVLEAGGYTVDSAASAAEAMQKLDAEEYSLVLTGRDMEAPDAGWRVVEHAKMMDYRPATAFFNAETDQDSLTSPDRKPLLIAPEDLPELLSKVADLISRRASRQIQRDMRFA
ncbi:MAG: response regulator [Acidobacteriota bacterium]|jgi:CheY-like chemotaxis protein